MEDAIDLRARRSIALLILAQVACLSLWFAAVAVLPALAAAHGLAAGDLAPLSTATQAGFVLGALALAISGLPDRLDPRRLFAAAAALGAAANLVPLVVAPDGVLAIGSRALVGACLAGVYPVGLKIAVGWSVRRRGLITSALVGALTLGSATPHLVALFGGADPTVTLLTTSLAGLLGGFVVLGTGLGPHHARAARFEPRAITHAWTHRPTRAAYLGYFGHMWELYAFWSWIGAASVVAATRAGLEDPLAFGSALTFVAIALGGVACVPAGWVADRVGKATIARAAMIGSAASGLLAAVLFEVSLVGFAVAVVLWGLTVIPDSAQFSALVADHAPPTIAGSLMTLQTAIGFALTILTVQLTPWFAAQAGWPATFVVLAIGPVVGAIAVGGARRGG